jgi:mRNA interferase MazF
MVTGSMTEPLTRGAVVWVRLDPARGREQAGTRPAVVLSTDGYLDAVPDLAIVVPVTTRDRGWPHHVQLAGRELSLPRASFAMTEQPRTISRGRISGSAGRTDDATMDSITSWIRDFVAL